MGKISTLKQNTAGNIASLQTVLERYPVLITTDEQLGKTSLDFSLNILKMFGVSGEDIIEWLSKILADKKDGSNGLLSTIELGVKAIILGSFKDLYTCTISPTLPDDIMLDFYKGEIRGNGIKIKIEDIDPMGQLSYCPTDKEIGKYFYFDNADYTPANIYSSMDFNAYLWYIINKGTDVNKNNLKSVWDNRGIYYRTFEKNGCLNGESLKDKKSKKGNFFSTTCENSKLRMVTGVGPKMEILNCRFSEDSEGSYLRIHLNADRYQYSKSLGLGNKTIFDFNADYLASIKLFDTKTLIAQTINSLLGLTASLKFNMSIEKNIQAKQIKAVVNQLIENDDAEDEGETSTYSDCYFKFDNKDYNHIMEEAILNFNGEYQSKNETNDNIDINTEEILSNLTKIETSENLEEEATAIKEAFKGVANTLSNNNEVDKKNQYTFELSIIEDFIKEVTEELVMQVLSPKVMLLYAINDKIMNTEGESKLSGIASFFENFGNLISAIAKKIYHYILQSLYDFLMGQIQPLIVIFVQRLLLETIMYYKILIDDLIANCTFDVNTLNADPLSIDNVIGADIIPSINNDPKFNGGCKAK